MKQKIRKILEQTVSQNAPSFVIERPKVKEHGEFSTNLALVLAKEAGKKPRELADEIANQLKSNPLFETVTVAGPGFINFVLKRNAWQESLHEIDKAGDRFGSSEAGKGKKVLVEFISANPTGPLHIGNARGGPLGDVIASLLEATGYEVTREFYVNDVGGQIDKLGESLLYWIQYPEGGGEPPGYQGEYVKELAREAAKTGKREIAELGKFGINHMTQLIKEDCNALGIKFDSWIHEKDILREKTDAIFQMLEKKGVTRRNEGAVWFAPQDEFLEDRECVLKKSDGTPTYFANDIAYHAFKFERGYHELINIWGANHHGHLPRMKGAVAALGYPPENLKTIFYQTVRLKRGGEVVTMSKRAGNIIMAREVVEEIGRDAFRFFLLMRAADSHMDLDLDLAKKHSLDNPVYYVQYAHARLASIFRKAEEQKIKWPAQKIDTTRLELPEEIDLIRRLHEYPEEITLATERLEPHRIPFYLLELSREFQSYYSRAKEDPRYRVLGSDVDTTNAKLYLCELLKRTIANGLKLIGVSCPEVMQSE